MSVPTDAQERTIAEIVANPRVVRTEVRPLADGSREVWCYGHLDMLSTIFTVFRGGNYAARPGIRATTDTHIGDPR